MDERVLVREVEAVFAEFWVSKEFSMLLEFGEGRVDFFKIVFVVGILPKEIT